ncbi:ABC transporter permease [Olivibacter sitiensis]|uniref:ABC transporter permease n=1 Tax=Olivibacter sitiensis TaxID=376470 RepID=UPI0004249CE1|nr:FtsX-like permease family protein [Olivibacter sitiensis]
MNFPYFLSKRITRGSHRRFSQLIVRVAIAGIVLGLAVMILSIAVLKGFKAEIIQKERNFNGDISIFAQNLNEGYEISPFSIDKEGLEKLLDIDGVAKLEAYATKPGIINVNDEVEGVVLKGIDSTYEQSRIDAMLIKGKGIDFRNDSVPSSGQIIISSYTANRLHLDVGDDFLMFFVQEPLRKRKFTIVGIYNLGLEEVDKTFVIGDIGVIRRLNNWEEESIGGYEVFLDDFSQLDLVNERILDLLPGDLYAQTVMESFPEIFSWLGLLDINTIIILVLMIVVATINMISALLIIILERTNMIGVLKALGMKNRGIRRMFVYHAIYLIGIGMLLGNVLGIGLCLLQHYTHLFGLDESSYYVSYVPIMLSWTDVLLLNVGTLFVCIVSLIIPSALVAKIDPIKAIRFK